jgi:type IV pilus assembly protein PilC
MLYKYEGRSLDGKLRKGTIEANSPNEAREKLKNMGIVSISKLVPHKSVFQIELFEQKLKPSDVLEFTYNLKSLIKAGVPLLTALEALRDETQNKRLKKILSTVIADVNEGVPLSSSLKKFKNEFGEIYIGMLEVAEKSGNLDKVLERIASYYEKQIKLRNKIKKAMTYPIIVVVVLILVLSILLYYVIPQFASIYEGFGSSLPAPTQLLINLSDWFKENILKVFLGVIGLVVFLKLLLRVEKVRKFVHRVILKVPVFGTLALYANTANLAVTLSSLLDSGVQLYEALEVAAKTLKNTYYKEKIAEVREKIRKGIDFAVAVKEAGVFPKMFVLMSVIGSKSGNLDEMLRNAANYYEEEVEKQIDRLTTMIEPALMVVIGGIVGFVLVALYLPIFNIGSVVGK